ncbi:MAG: dicarboxylate transporter, DctM subunit [Acidobacteria bacterium]|nr:dicarboxylate transporter, DctM subunit [Acidobacteriota bacterium]
MRLAAGAARVEEGALVAVFAVATLLPIIEAVGRPLGGLHVPGSAAYLQQATIWLTFLGGLYALRQGKHLTMSTAELLGFSERVAARARLYAYAVAAAVVSVLAVGALRLVAVQREAGAVLPLGVPQWWLETVMPVTLALLAARFAWSAAAGWRGRAAALAAVAVVWSLAALPRPAGPAVWLLVAAIAVAVLLGAPMFVGMAGLALLFFFRDFVPVSAVPAEIYRLVASPTLPAIPLLTACGYVLAESRAATRLVRFFNALFGWMPGGVAVLVASVCAVFTTFTGGSGVTIIALGGLVYPIMRKEGYPEGFSLGLVSASGSLGLLFPPSLPVILYGVVASVPADRLYLAGLVPGLILVVLVAAYGLAIGRRSQASTTPFAWRELGAAAWGAKWELSTPAVVVVLFATGLASLVEASAFACLYAVVVECFVTRDIHPVRELPKVVLKAAALVGGVLLLLASAMGLTSYLVDAQVPDALLAWVQQTISSPLMFLLALNLLLLVLGSVLEIYSAIIVLAPLIAPIGAAFGIDPVHLGVIFLANLEVGFILPPVGLNLFLSSARFNVPITRLYRHVLPFLAILAAGVLLITYVPALSVGVLRLLGR